MHEWIELRGIHRQVGRVEWFVHEGAKDAHQALRAAGFARIAVQGATTRARSTTARCSNICVFPASWCSQQQAWTTCKLKVALCKS